MKRVLSFAAVAGALFAAVPAAAQQLPASPPPRTDRPSRALFGSGTGSADQALTLSLSFGGGYNTNVLRGTPNIIADDGTITPGTGTGQIQSTRSTFEQASASLGYSLSGARAGINASFTSSAVNIPVSGQPLFTTDGAGFGGTFRPTKHTTITGSESFTYSPFYSLVPIDALLNPSTGSQPISVADFANEVQLGTHTYWATGVGLSHQASQRLSFSVAFSDTQSKSSTDSLDSTIVTGSAGLSYALGKGLNVGAGYQRARSTFGPEDDRSSIDGQSFNGGLNFNRSLSLTRRLTLAFATGLTAVTDGNATQYGFIGNAALTREIGRSWSAALTYSRSVGYVEEFRHPVFSDSLAASFGGAITRILQFHSGVGVSRGNVGIDQANSEFVTTYATTGLTLGLSESVGLGVSYSYFRYNFGTGVFLPTGLAQHANSQSVQVFLTLFEPLFTRQGPSHAAR